MPFLSFLLNPRVLLVLAAIIAVYGLYNKIRSEAMQEGVDKAQAAIEKKIDDHTTFINNKIKDIEDASRAQADKIDGQQKTVDDKLTVMTKDLKNRLQPTTTIINGQCLLNENFIKGYNALTEAGK